MSKRRVVVTGLGLVTPLGLNVKDTWSAILEGKSGISTVDSFPVDDLPVRFCGQVKNFDPELYGIEAKESRKMAVFTQFALAATQQALQDSGLKVTESNSHRIGVAVGSGIGGLTTITENYDRLEKGGPRKVSPFFIPTGIINMAAGQISISYGLRGPNIAIVTACTTGTHNIGSAARMIAYGDANVMVAGGTEMATSRLCLTGFAACRALSTRNDEPQKASRPWDKDRDGFVLGEGAGVVILEELEHAKKRGAPIYAELIGYGMSADAYHITAPDETGSGWMLAIGAALKDAGISGDKIDYINAHGTSTPIGDVLEAKVTKMQFGEHAKKLAISSTKSMTGHLLGATGAVEAIFSILAIRDNVVPPTINLDNPEEGCDLNFVPHVAQQRTVNTSLSNSFGFGGTNATVIFSRY